MRCLFQALLLQSEDESPGGNEEEVEKITLKRSGWCALTKFPRGSTGEQLIEERKRVFSSATIKDVN